MPAFWRILHLRKEGIFLNKVNKIVYLGLLICLEVIFTRFLSIQTPIIRIGFGFLPIAATGVLLGPLWAGIAAALADILGMMIFPKGAYFLGFTVSAFVSGVIYGIVFYKKPISIFRSTIAVAAIIVFVDLFMNTYWLTMITGKAASVILYPRLIKTIIMLPIQTVLIFSLWKVIEKLDFLRKFKRA